MLSLALINIVILLSLVSLSLLFFNYEPHDNSGKHFINGLTLLSITLVFISLFTAVGSSFIILVSFISLFSLVKNRAIIKSLLFNQYGFLLFSFVAIISFFMGYDHYPYNSDTDIYHMNAVQWIAKYGTVPGLANLSNRLGLNSTWHILGAFFEHGILFGRSPWILPCISYISAFAYFFHEIVYKREIWKVLFSTLILLWTLINILTWGFPSLHYDFPPLLINAIVFYEVCKTLQENKSPSIQTQFIWMVLLSFSFTLKQLGAVSLIFLFAYCAYTQYQTKSLNLKNLFKVSGLPILIFLAWAFRNTLLSGYPFFPSTALRLNFDWTLPNVKVLEIYYDIIGWARVPGPNYLKYSTDTSYGWLPLWLDMQMQSIRFKLIFLIPFFSAIIIWLINLVKSFDIKSGFSLVWMFSSILFWFFTAPDIRFGDGFFFCFLGAALCFNSPISHLKSTHQKWNLLTAIILLGLTLLSTSMLLYKKKRGPVNLLYIGTHGPGPIQKVKTLHNLEVWVPIQATSCKNSGKNFICPENKMLYKEVTACGNSPLPCTPFFKEDLALRGEGLGEGFKLK